MSPGSGTRCPNPPTASSAPTTLRCGRSAPRRLRPRSRSPREAVSPAGGPAECGAAAGGGSALLGLDLQGRGGRGLLAGRVDLDDLDLVGRVLLEAADGQLALLADL